MILTSEFQTGFPAALENSNDNADSNRGLGKYYRE
jgi:hypothetical protein